MTLPDGAIVSLRGVGKTFENGVVALDGLSLDIANGEFVSLLGPSGCGKSTALCIIAGLSETSAGTVATAPIFTSVPESAFIFCFIRPLAL